MFKARGTVESSVGLGITGKTPVGVWVTNHSFSSFYCRIGTVPRPVHCYLLYNVHILNGITVFMLPYRASAPLMQVDLDE